jgi:hypothetical protein
MTNQESRISELLSDAKQFMYNAKNGPALSREYWIEKAKDKAFEASLVPEDFKYPESKMPEWGTYGT